ncbi:ATP-binding protein [Candidatus Halobeggiatoa sp. HSG11]|nr:ATP-binding protein [Candidatus Halobeggiatoa sp. HSG11]
MIKSFEIKNFRCFEHTKAVGFSRINLIGGRNNAGKTALLEALLLMGKPSNQSIARLLGFREVSKKFIEEMPQKAWNNFFYQQNNTKKISFNFVLDDKTDNKVTINCDEKIDDFISMKDEQNEDIMSEFANSLANTNAVKSSLHINADADNTNLQTNVFVASPNGLAGKGIPHIFIDTYLIPASFRLKNDKLAIEFDKAKFEGNSEALLKAFQIVDSIVEEITAFKLSNDAELFLKRKNEDYMSLSLFGDAMNKIANFILRIVNNKDSILLIDEIENGIHYENQEEIWKVLFELCEKYNVQLFATSHSYEMIEAFKNTIVKNNLQNGNYFEMGRHSISNKITIQKIPINSLENKINNERPIRGEQTNKRKLS